MVIRAPICELVGKAKEYLLVVEFQLLIAMKILSSGNLRASEAQIVLELTMQRNSCGYLLQASMPFFAINFRVRSEYILEIASLKE